MSIFVADDLVEVSVKYFQLGQHDLIVLRTKEEEEFYAKNESPKVCKAKFARPGWENFNNYLDNTIRESVEESSSYLDTVRLRKNKFRTLLREMEDDGKKVLINKDFFTKIIPDLAISLVEEYDNKLNDERHEVLKNLGVFEDEPKEEKNDVKKEELETESLSEEKTIE
jgi:hypothetical protein